MKYIYILISIILISSCEKESTFTEIEGLNDEFPESLFSFSGDYEAFMDNIKTRDSSFIYPRPLDTKSFESFSATSTVEVDDNIRYALCKLAKQDYFLSAYVPATYFTIKLNISPIGDVNQGTLFKKQELLDFLEIDKDFSTTPDERGSIELIWEWDYEYVASSRITHFAGRDFSGNTLQNDYNLRIVSVEDYQDVTRTGDLIKDALKVTIDFEGELGVQSRLGDGASLDEDISHINITDGTATFLVDYIE